VLWDSVPVFRNKFMRRVAGRPRVLMTTGSVAVVWLLLASTTYAAPAPRKSAGGLCGPLTGAVEKFRFPRLPKSFGGPLATPSKHALAGLTDGTARIKRCSQAEIDDDDEAIQNDAPAARIDSDERANPILRPIGICQGPQTRRLHTRLFSPRSPRGPPADAPTRDWRFGIRD
jgi:hypothetical protein